jgi:demethylmenaquinone methyltransferase/2-methoxy-6-polyprenyl-1,4-benzoquinol methylase
MNEKIKKPDIEVTGLEARFYDFFVLIGTFGLYQKLIKKVIQDMNIQPGDRILDLGAGTGKNALLMHDYLTGGEITALEIGRQMRRQFQKKCGKYENIYLENRRIERPLPYENRFDKIFISYVIHGFEQEDRERIVYNSYRALKRGGQFFIFDWNEFDVEDSSFIIRNFIRRFECEPAQDFIQRDFESVLKRHGFHGIEKNLYFRDKIRLLSGIKSNTDKERSDDEET